MPTGESLKVPVLTNSKPTFSKMPHKTLARHKIPYQTIIVILGLSQLTTNMWIWSRLVRPQSPLSRTTINMVTSSESHPLFLENKVLVVSHEVVTLPYTNETMPQFIQADLVEVENPWVSEVVLSDVATLTVGNGNLFINIPQILKTEVVPDVPDMCAVLPEDPADVADMQTETLESRVYLTS